MSAHALSLVDPDLRAALSALPNFDLISDHSLQQFRAALAGDPLPTGICGTTRVEHVEAIGDDGHRVPCLLYRPMHAKSSAPVILNIHGGGFVMGTAAREHTSMLVLSQVLGCAVLSVDYRLAPEVPFPGASDDCLAALEWLHRQAGELGVDRKRLAVRGVSAGGGLAAGLALRVRHREELAIALMVLIYPMLDDRPAAPSQAGQFVWTRKANAFGWSAFLGAIAADPGPVAVPARERDLTKFPSTYICVGDIDLFAAENLAFASRLIDAGVPTELHVYRGAYHGFNLVVDAPIAQRFEKDCIAAFTRVFAAEEE